MQLTQTLVTAVCCLYLVLLLGGCSCKSTMTSEKHSEMRLIGKFNRSMCTPQSLEATPVRLIFQSRGNRVPINKPYILSNFDLKKYEYIDTEYVEGALKQPDELILRNSQTPREVFEEQRLTVENYMILGEKEFRLTLVNPTSSFRICVHRVFVDSPEVELREQRRMPFCLAPHTKYPLQFSVYMHEHRVNRFLRTAIFLEVELNDTKTGLRVEHKIWTKEVVVSVHNNWLNLGRIEFEEQGQYTSIELENSFDEELRVDLSSTLLLRSESDPKQQKNKLSLALRPKERWVVQVQNKKGFLLIDGELYGKRLDTLRVPVTTDSKFYIDTINVGIITSKKQSVQLLLTVTNVHNASIFIEEIELNSKLRTGLLRRIDNLTNEVKPMVAYSPIALIRLHSSIKDDVVVKCHVRVKYWLSSAPAGTSLEAESEFHYAEIHSPLSSLEKRFIYVDKEKPTLAKKLEESLFPVKNSLNLPMKLTRVIIDETKFKITWLSETRDYIYPNQQSFLFGLEHLPTNIVMDSPVTIELMLLEFNHNLLIPVELMLYDKKLECSFENVTRRCAKLGTIDVGYVRSGVQTIREVKIRNLNPTSIDVNMSLLKSNGEVKMTVVYGEGREDTMEGRLVRAHLRARSFITIRLTIKCMHNVVFALPQVKFRTADELFLLKFVYKMSQGTLTVFPNPLAIADTSEKLNNYLYVQSSLSEPYTFISITPNDSDVVVHYEPKILVPIIEVKALSAVYTSSIVRNDCCHDEHLLDDMRYITVELGRVLKHIEVKILTSNDFLITTNLQIVKQDVNLINQSLAQFNVIESTNNNHYSVEVTNPYKSPISVRGVLVDPQLPRNWRDVKARLESLLAKSNFYFCVSEAAKDRLKLTPQSIKALFRMEQVPIDFFIDTLENSSFYLHWLRKVEMKQHDELTEEMSEEMVNIILGGARYCYKGEAPAYFQELVVSDIFNQLIEHASPQVFLEVVERECEHLLKPTFTKRYDSFYDRVFHNLEEDISSRYLSGSSYPCIFKFCHYIPVILSPDGVRTLMPNEKLQFTMSLLQTNTSMRTSLIVLSNMTSAQECLIQCKIVTDVVNVTKMLLKVEGLILYGIHFSKDEFVSHYLPEARIDLTRSLPVYLTLQEMTQGTFSGTRTFVLKNFGHSTIAIQSIVFEETMSCEHPTYKLENCAGFTIPGKQAHNLTVEFKFGVRGVGKAVQLILFCNKFFYRLELVSMLGQPANSLNLPASEEQLYLYLAITLASIVYIFKLLRLIKEEQARDSKVRTIFDKAQHLPVEDKPRSEPIRLPEEFLLRYTQEKKSKMTTEQTEVREGSRKLNDSENENDIISQPSASKDELSSYDELKSYDKSEQSVCEVEAEKHGTFESNSSLSSGSSLSQGFMAEINEYAFGRYDRSNSDVNEEQSVRSAVNSNEFYDVFKSEGPIKKKNSEDIVDDEDEDGSWLKELTRISSSNRERGQSHTSSKKEPRA